MATMTRRMLGTAIALSAGTLPFLTPHRAHAAGDMSGIHAFFTWLTRRYRTNHELATETT